MTTVSITVVAMFAAFAAVAMPVLLPAMVAAISKIADEKGLRVCQRRNPSKSHSKSSQ